MSNGGMDNWKFEPNQALLEPALITIERTREQIDSIRIDMNALANDRGFSVSNNGGVLTVTFGQARS